MDYTQKPIITRGIAVGSDGSLSIFGPRSEVPALTRPGKRCRAETCLRNADQVCGADKREQCPSEIQGVES